MINTPMLRAAPLFMAAMLIIIGPVSGFAQKSQKDGLSFTSSQPVEIHGDKLEVMEDGRVNILTGNVSVTQGPNLLRAGKMTVYINTGSKTGTASGGDIERILVEGGVYAKSDKQVATGDRGSYDMKAQVLELSGKEVVLTEGENVVVGCKLTIRSSSGQATLESCKNSGSTAGRVKMLITPPARNAQ